MNLIPTLTMQQQERIDALTKIIEQQKQMIELAGKIKDKAIQKGYLDKIEVLINQSKELFR